MMSDEKNQARHGADQASAVGAEDQAHDGEARETTPAAEAVSSLAESPETTAADDQASPHPLELELAEAKDRNLRVLAEMENLRRRTERDVDEARRYAITSFARGLLDVADNLARALASVPVEARERDEFIKNLVVGVEMTERSLQDLLAKHQVKKVVPERGVRFDHNLHQAMFEVASTDYAPGSVAEVMQPGYVIADRLLRPAMVGVTKAPPQAAAPPGNDEPGSRIDQSA